MTDLQFFIPRPPPSLPSKLDEAKNFVQRKIISTRGKLHNCSRKRECGWGRPEELVQGGGGCNKNKNKLLMELCREKTSDK